MSGSDFLSLTFRTRFHACIPEECWSVRMLPLLLHRQRNSTTPGGAGCRQARHVPAPSERPRWPGGRGWTRDGPEGLRGIGRPLNPGTPHCHNSAQTGRVYSRPPHSGRVVFSPHSNDQIRFSFRRTRHVIMLEGDILYEPRRTRAQKQQQHLRFAFS